MPRGVEGLVIKEVCFYKNAVKITLTDPLKVYSDCELRFSTEKFNGIPAFVMTVDQLVIFKTGYLP